MQADTVIALYLGVFIEILSLWEIARREHGKRITLPHLPSWLTPERLVMLLLLLLGLTIIGVLQAIGVREFSYALEESLTMAIAVPLGVFAFLFGMLNPFLLPRVNEQMLFTVYVTMIVGGIVEGDLNIQQPWLLLGGSALGLVLLWASISKWSLPPGIKGLGYLGYLTGLGWLGFQQVMAFNTLSNELSPLYGFTFGVSIVFYVLHLLFWARFFLILNSMLIPAHWRFLPSIMRRLFADTQNSLKDVALSLGSALGLLLVNRVTGALPASLFLSLLVPLIVQGLNHLQRLRASRQHAR